MSDRILIGGREVFMSYGLLTELSRIVPDLDSIPSIAIDNELRDKFIGLLLSSRDAQGNPTGESLSLHTLTVDDIGSLIDWAEEHLVDFFLKRAVNAQAQFNKIKTRLEQSSSSGTQA